MKLLLLFGFAIGRHSQLQSIHELAEAACSTYLWTIRLTLDSSIIMNAAEVAFAWWCSTFLVHRCTILSPDLDDITCARTIGRIMSSMNFLTCPSMRLATVHSSKLSSSSSPRLGRFGVEPASAASWPAWFDRSAPLLVLPALAPLLDWPLGWCETPTPFDSPPPRMAESDPLASAASAPKAAAPTLAPASAPPSSRPPPFR
eukprot:CAMPEP_0114270128 /NCGR_PEP_ID=MMETSP0058-20121206/27053_1 /TAXON_ID=36894 /ORGANISM="Pyramimonas parkeae, CCMP726" /LENGTH=201 /DNA_ID=CAMNT_0001388805 /DNA_START=100 /DNA_END=701 /DNA_ORIENTATION=+